MQKRWYPGSLAVLPEYEHKGLGSRLVEHVEKRASEKGVKYVRFDAVANNQALTNFYLKRGYKTVGKRRTRDTESNFFEKEV